MSISDKIEKINNNIENAYSACSTKGATLPTVQNSTNLANCINSITSGSAGSSDLKPLMKKGWAWKSQNTGRAYFLKYNTGPTYDLMCASFKSLVKNFSTNYSGGFTSYILDGNFYYRNYNTNNYIKCSCDITDWISYSSIGASGLAIRADGSLYYYYLTPTGNATINLIDNTGVWTVLSSYYSSGTFGIRSGVLCRFLQSSKSITVVDNTGVWTDVCGLSYGVDGFGIKNSQLYRINISDGSSTLLSSEVGFTAVSGSNNGLAICNGNLYSIKSSGVVTLLDNTQTWVKLAGESNALTSTGKLYYTSGSSISQVGTDENWTDIRGQSSGGAVGINNGDAYWCLQNGYLKRITSNANIVQIDGIVSTISEPSRTNLVMVSGNQTNETLYTVAYPDAENFAYTTNNFLSLHPPKVVAKADDFSYITVLPLINGELQKLYRDSSKDTDFVTTPSENTRTEYLLDCME